MPVIASYPTQIATFTTKTDQVDVVFADHINALQAEVRALQSVLGTLPTGSAATVRDRIAAVEGALGVLSGRFDGSGLIPESGVAGLVTDLGGKAPTVHSHVIAQITDLAAANVSGADTLNNDTARMHMHWSGQGGQPSWLWGGNDPNNQYVYNPSNFHVALADNATHATTADSATSASSATTAGSASTASAAPWSGITGKPLTNIKGGVTTRTFSGGAFTLPHGLGVTPQSAAVTTISGGGTDTIVMLSGPTSWDSTNLYLRASIVSTSTNYSGSITFAWVAFG